MITLKRISSINLILSIITFIREIKKESNVGRQFTIRGWVHRLRKQKEKSFILIRDEKGDVVQTVFQSEQVSNITLESSIQVTGILSVDKRAPEGGYELQGKNIEIFNISENFPIGEFQSLDLLLTKRHLAIRTRKLISILKIKSTILKYARLFFDNLAWTEVQCPTIVKGSIEGGSTLFPINYFDEKAYLSQSAQLYLEAYIFSLGPVWTISPSFRAEKSRTVRHLAEFLHLEAEVPWTSMDDLLNIQENLVTFIINNLKKERTDEFVYLNRNISDLNITPPFPRLEYSDVIDDLRKKDFKIEEDGKKRYLHYGDDLNIESERMLTQQYSTPIFVVGYPLSIKPFYVKSDIHDENRSLSADMLAPHGFGEITSGGLREDDLAKLKERIQKEGLDQNTYDWYLDLRRYGSVIHGGFGLGIERFLRWLINSEDIKETVGFPRTMSRISP